MPWSALAIASAALPLIILNLRRGRAQFDQQFFHEPTIRDFIAQWPRPDLSHYLSATTPGYHLVLAAVGRFADDRLVVLKLVGSLFTIALLWILEAALRNRLCTSGPERAHKSRVNASSAPSRPAPARGAGALALLAPLLCSMYFLTPGVWLQPDNAGWLGVLIVMLIALRPRWDRLSLVGGGIAMLLLVWTRQIHLWAAGVLWAAAWVPRLGHPASPRRVGAPHLSEAGSSEAHPASSIRWFITPDPARLARTAFALAATLPALLSLAWFAHKWGGLTPPGNGGQFHQQHDAGFNAATPAFTLSLMAIYSVFFWAWVRPGLDQLKRLPRVRLLLAACIISALLTAAIPATTYSYEPRATGLWNIVRFTSDPHITILQRTFALHLTLFNHTSPLILLLSPLGAVALAAWLIQLPRREGWIFGLIFAGFVAAQSANSNAWQRYVEPMLLMTIALMGATLGWRQSRLSWAGPCALGLLNASVTAYTLWSEPVVTKTW